VRVSKLRWLPFRVPFRTPFFTAHGVYIFREGLVLWLETDAGIVGLGEASPIAQATGSLGKALTFLEQTASAFVGKEVEAMEACLEGFQEGSALTAVRCALDIAACDALAKAKGVNVAALLGSDVASSVPVNATIGASTAAEARDAAAAARAAGFHCVKLKVGLAEGVDEERERVAAVRDALGPDIALRLDANGAWTVGEAISTIKTLEEYNLELVEQPVAPCDLGAMVGVRQAVDTPIAADEDITSLDAARRVLEAGAADALVLKPMMLGGLRLAYKIAQLARSTGASVIVTTTIDAGIATAAALHLAAVLPTGGPACGLASGSLLAGDLIDRALNVKDGQMELPAGPGLGVELDQGELKQFGYVNIREAP